MAQVGRQEGVGGWVRGKSRLIQMMTNHCYWADTKVGRQEGVGVWVRGCLIQMMPYHCAQ